MGFQLDDKIGTFQSQSQSTAITPSHFNPELSTWILSNRVLVDLKCADINEKKKNKTNKNKIIIHYFFVKSNQTQDPLNSVF